MPSYPTRVAAAAADMHAVRGLLTILALPFYLLGLIIGIVVVSVTWAVAAVKVGVTDIKARAESDDEAA